MSLDSSDFDDICVLDVPSVVVVVYSMTAAANVKKLLACFVQFGVFCCRLL